MSQDIITMLQDYVLSGTVTLPEGETVEDIVQHLNSFNCEDNQLEEAEDE